MLSPWCITSSDSQPASIPAKSEYSGACRKCRVLSVTSCPNLEDMIIEGIEMEEDCEFCESAQIIYDAGRIVGKLATYDAMADALKLVFESGCMFEKRSKVAG